MIKVPISYSQASHDVILAIKDLASEDWSDPKFADVRNEIKEHYKSVQNYTCPYCQQRINIAHNMVWDIEHVIPRKLKPGFMFEPQNLCIACKDCNGPKSDENVLVNKGRKTFPKKPGDYRIVHPHFHNYKEHIEILVDGLVYRALSDQGKFTIVACDLLRFYKFTQRSSIQDLSTDLAKKIAFAVSPEDKEKAELQYLDYLQLKHRK